MKGAAGSRPAVRMSKRFTPSPRFEPRTVVNAPLRAYASSRRRDAMLETALKVEKAAGCGAYVHDVDLADLTDAEVDTLRQALFDNGVLFFRGQNLTPEQHIALAERFAPIDVNRFFPADPAYPQIAKVEKTEAQVVNIGGGWHTDHSYDREPAMGSILVARTLPPSGGDTLFADMYAAYDTLAPELQEKLRGMKAVHSSA